MPGTIKEAHLSFADKCLRWFCYGVVHLVHRPKVYGPKPEIDGPCIFACRHVGLMDPVILMVEYLPWMLRPLVAKDYYEKSNFTKSFYRHAQCIPLDRKKVSTQWVEESLEALGKGESIIIFPEGKRNKSGKGLLPFQNGAALLSYKTGAKIVPVWNEYWDFPHRYRMSIGEPFNLDPVPEEGPTSEWLNLQSAKIQAAVAALEQNCHSER